MDHMEKLAAIVDSVAIPCLLSPPVACLLLDSKISTEDCARGRCSDLIPLPLLNAGSYIVVHFLQNGFPMLRKEKKTATEGGEVSTSSISLESFSSGIQPNVNRILNF